MRNYGHGSQGGLFGGGRLKNVPPCGPPAKIVIPAQAGNPKWARGSLHLLSQKKKPEWIPAFARMTMLRVPSINTSSPVSLCPPNSHFQPPPTPVIPAKAGIQAVSRLHFSLSARRKNRMDPRVRALLSGINFGGLTGRVAAAESEG